MTEFFRRGTESLPFCQVHSGSAPVNAAEGAIDLTPLAAIDTSPVRPKEATLLGDDPYHSLQPTAEGLPAARPRGPGSNVLEGFDFGEGGRRIELPRPRRLDILPD